ncbi:MAG TPA: DUF1684 domain-containing protein, partial [Flavisolibacter sp.]
MRPVLFLLLLSCTIGAFAQETYADSLRSFRENYIQTHEVVQGKDRSKMRFYPISRAYRVVADFKKAENSQWLSFPTSGKLTKIYRVYGTLSFVLDGHPLQLQVYQSQDLLQRTEYQSYLFLPFTDVSNTDESYEGGRYMDLAISAIQNNTVLLDFNKAYNPYCAYV